MNDVYKRLHARVEVIRSMQLKFMNEMPRRLLSNPNLVFPYHKDFCNVLDFWVKGRQRMAAGSLWGYILRASRVPTRPDPEDWALFERPAKSSPKP